MSAVVVCSVNGFLEILTKLVGLGIDAIHFYNAHNEEDRNPPIFALVPFVDCVILGRDAGFSGQLSRVIEEAITRHIPVLSECCLDSLTNLKNRYNQKKEVTQ
jgi:hypothetical protein